MNKHAQLIRTNVFEYKLSFVEVQSSLIQCNEPYLCHATVCIPYSGRHFVSGKVSSIKYRIDNAFSVRKIVHDDISISRSAQQRGHRLRSAIKYNISRLKSNNIFGFYFYQKHVEVAKCNRNCATMLQHIPFR